MRTLIVYATDEGQTEKIGRRISDELNERQCPADHYNVALDPNDPIALDAYDAVIVGSPVHHSHFDTRLAEYLKNFSEPLREIPSAFFSVSLGILSEDQAEQDQVRELTDAYLAEVGWNPPIKIHFAGALQYSKYNWLKRWLMSAIVRKGGGPADTQFDYEFTDWEQVNQFVERFVAFVESCKKPDQEYTQHSSYEIPTRRYSIHNRPVSEV